MYSSGPCTGLEKYEFGEFSIILVNMAVIQREKVRAKRINLEGNTHAQEINVGQCPV
jgi:hypothetical protein